MKNGAVDNLELQKYLLATDLLQEKIVLICSKHFLNLDINLTGDLEYK